MKRLLSTLTMLLLINTAFAQNGVVSGTVTDNNNLPLFGVNVTLNNSTKGTQTNEYGKFEITNMKDGYYVLSFSYLGFKTREIRFTISNNQPLTLDAVILYEGNEILSEVIIEGGLRNKFSRKKTAYVSKLPLKDIENTQVYSTVTNGSLKSQIVTNFDDALKNATGVEQLSG